MLGSSNCRRRAGQGCWQKSKIALIYKRNASASADHARVFHNVIAIGYDQLISATVAMHAVQHFAIGLLQHTSQSLRDTWTRTDHGYCHVHGTSRSRLHESIQKFDPRQESGAVKLRGSQETVHTVALENIFPSTLNSQTSGTAGSADAQLSEGSQSLEDMRL